MTCLKFCKQYQFITFFSDLKKPAKVETDDGSAICSSLKRVAVVYKMAAATSVVVLDRGNNTTCTINLHG